MHNALAVDGVHCLLKRMEGGRWRVRHGWLGGGAVRLLVEAFIDAACLQGRKCVPQQCRLLRRH